MTEDATEDRLPPPELPTPWWEGITWTAGIGVALWLALNAWLSLIWFLFVPTRLSTVVALSLFVGGCGLLVFCLDRRRQQRRYEYLLAISLTVIGAPFLATWVH